jgi:hypothetical protein
MRHLIPFLLFTQISIADGGFTLSRTDHLAHLGLSYIGSDLIYETIRTDPTNFDTGAHLSACFAMFSVGLGKEFLIDSHPEGGDIVANLLGSCGRVVIKIPLND